MYILKSRIVSYSIFIFSYLLIPSASAKDVHLVLIGGGWIEENSSLYEFDASHVYNMLKKRGIDPIIAFGNGPRSIPNEGYSFRYSLAHKNQVEKGAKFTFVEKKRYRPFRKDFDGDGKIDVDFPGTKTGMRDATKQAVSQLGPGDKLYVHIGGHGGLRFDFDLDPKRKKKKDFVERGTKHFSSLGELSTFVPRAFSDFDASIDSDIGYDEFYGWLQEDGLPRDATVTCNGQGCYGGSSLRLTQQGNFCGIAAATSEYKSSGGGDPKKWLPPGHDIPNLNSYVNLGHLYHYTQYLKDHPNSSMKDAYWYSLYRDMRNTPLSSLEYVIYEYHQRTSKSHIFNGIFGALHKSKEKPSSEHAFCVANSGSYEGVAHENIRPRRPSESCTYSAESIRSGALAQFSKPPQGRESEFKEYRDRLQNLLVSEPYKELITAQQGLVAALKKQAEKLGAVIGMSYYDFIKMEEGVKVAHLSKIFKVQGDALYYLDSYNEFAKDEATHGYIAGLYNNINTHLAQLSYRLSMYLEFVTHSNNEEFEKFRQVEACMEKKV